jgi:hypothetical protein
MNSETREPEPVDDDIPTLTEIVVPGRLPAHGADPVPPTPPEFVFDIDFTGAETSAAEPYDYRTQPVPAVSEPVVEPPTRLPASEEADLPLPWSTDSPPGLAMARTPPSPVRSEATEPLIVAAHAKAQADTVRAASADDPRAALLRELLDEIGAGLEQRLRDEMVLTEQRLRTALGEELDRKLRDLLASAPPTS